MAYNKFISCLCYAMCLILGQLCLSSIFFQALESQNNFYLEHFCSHNRKKKTKHGKPHVEFSKLLSVHIYWLEHLRLVIRQESNSPPGKGSEYLL